MSNCNNSSQNCGENNIYVSGAETRSAIEVTNNKSRYYAELAEIYKNKAKEYCDSARYYAEQNSDVSMNYVNNLEATLRNLIDGKQDAGEYALSSEIPTKTSDLTNDSSYATTSQIPTNNNQLTNGAGYITGISSADVTAALTYTPANTDGSNMASSVKNIDGQWTSSVLEIVTSMSMSANTTYDYSLSTYLPNDNYIYEVLVAGHCHSGSTSGNQSMLNLGSAIIDVNNYRFLGGQTRSSASVASSGCAIIPIGADRKLYLRQDSNNACTCDFLRVVGYRRIGTNQ